MRSELEKELRRCLASAAQARRLAAGLTMADDRERLLLYAAELDRRAADIEAQLKSSR
jgi:hypothetical protein